MLENKPLVSVIIPVYNGEAFLGEAIASIKQQSHHPLEIIIVDDGSTDGTAKIATNFNADVNYLYQQNSGPPAARNNGLRIAKGNVIGFLDADDLWADNKLELQLSILAENPSVEIVLGHTQYIRVREGVKESQPKFEKYPDKWPALSFGGAIIRKSAFDKVGLLDEGLPYNDDVDWFLRAKELGISMIIHQDVTQYYRRHEQNITNQSNLNHSYFVSAFKKSLDRRRKSGEGVVIPIPKWLKSDD